MEQRARDVLKIGDALFDKRRQVDTLWQEIALNFYPERADFTTKRNEGEEFNDHNFSSYPILARRELGNVLSSYLYSRSQKRFSIHVTDEEIDKSDAERKFLEALTDIQWRAITQQHSGFPISIEVAAALKEDIRAGFFLDKIQLPETGKDMTAFEVRRRVEEHIRAQTPIFDPIEEEYAPLYEGTFQLLSDAGAFPMHEMPESLTDQDIRFSFFSPLSDLADQREAETFVDVRDRILGPVAAVDPAQLENVEWTTATRDAMRAAGWKAKWFKPKEAVEARQEQLAKQAMLAKGAEALGVMGQVAEQGGKGMAALRDAGNGGQA